MTIIASIRSGIGRGGARLFLSRSNLVGCLK